MARSAATKAQRAVVIAVLLLLLVGFAYSGLATARQYRQIFRSEAVTSREATIDALIAPLQLSSGNDLRDSVLRAGWSVNDDVLILGAASAVSAQELQQIYYSTSYLLYPRHVWLAAWCDPGASSERCRAFGLMADPNEAIKRYGTRQVMLVGRANPFPYARSRPLTSVLSLVQLP